MAIAERADVRGLAAALVINALHDCLSREPLTALDALLFLTGEELEYWQEAAGFEAWNIPELIQNGRVRRANFRKG